MRYLIRRIGFYLVALWASVTLNFLIPHLSPGNPAQALMARMRGKLSPQAQHALEISLGVNHDPLWSQYLQYINNLLHGNLGVSITYLPTPVIEVIKQDLPWTLVLVGVALVMSFVIGSVRASSSFGGAVLSQMLYSLLSSLFLCNSLFLVGLVLLYILGSQLNWFLSMGV
jgi:peptide/nickel transport system permease protein